MMRLLLGIIAAGGSVATSYCTAQATIDVRVSRIEERVDGQYRQLMQRIEDTRGDLTQFRTEVKADINGTRGEIMGILRELRKTPTN